MTLDKVRAMTPAEVDDAMRALARALLDEAEVMLAAPVDLALTAETPHGVALRGPSPDELRVSLCISDETWAWSTALNVAAAFRPEGVP